MIEPKPSSLLGTRTKLETANGLKSFKFTDELQSRADLLLERSKSGLLTAEEKTELEGISELAQIFSYVNSVLAAESKESATRDDRWLSKEQNTSVNITTACSNFDKIYDETISTREPIVITRKGSESVSVIPEAELNSLRETAYLFGAGENAWRLLEALQRAKARTNKPRSIE